MQDLNLRDAHHADHRCRDGCLPGLGQSSTLDTCPWQELNLHTRLWAREFESRASACSATGAVLPTAPTGSDCVRALTRIRTWTERVLSALPLPLGYKGIHPSGWWSLSRESNPVPPVYETGVLPGELDRRGPVWVAAGPTRPVWSDARESNAVCPDPKSGGLPSPSHPVAAASTASYVRIPYPYQDSNLGPRRS